MTSEEKDLINQIRSKDAELKAKENAIKRLGESLEEVFILDLLPSKKLMQELEAISVEAPVPAGVKRKAKALLKKYKL